MKEESTVKVEGIRTIFPNDYQIQRKIDEEGVITYQHPGGNQVETYDESLYDIIECGVERFQTLIEMLDDGDQSSFGSLFRILIENLDDQLYEIFTFMDKTIGNITCTRVNKGANVYRRDRCVGVSITPPTADEESLHFTVDPELLEILKRIPLNKTESLKCIAGILARGDSVTWYPVTSGKTKRGAEKASSGT